MTKELTPYDPAAALVDQEEIAFFMADAFETGDAAYIAKALGVVARAKGMTEISQKTGLSREQLYRSFSERGNPTLKTILAVMQALGLDIATKPHMGINGDSDRDLIRSLSRQLAEKGPEADRLRKIVK